MKFKDCRFTSKNRRGLSTIVGALLFVVLMVATFAVLGVALDSQTEIVSTSRDVADKGLKKQQEDFTISSIVQPVADDLEVKLLNKGQNPTEIFTMVITEVDDMAGGFPTNTFDIPSSTGYLAPGDDVPTDIVSTTPISLTLAIPPTLQLEYEIKVISSLGTIKTLSVVCDEFTCGPPPGAPAGPSSLTAQLFLDGPTGVNSKTSTIILFVTNNGEQPLTGVAPLLGLGVGECDDMWQGNIPLPGPPLEIDDVDPCTLDSPSPVDLIPGQSAFFKWDGTVMGIVDDEAVFCNQASGLDTDGNAVTSGTVCDVLTVIDPTDCGGIVCDGGGEGGATIILIDDLLTRPSLFMIVPSPFGEDVNTNPIKQKGVWGVNLVNPTEVDMTVSKVTIVSYPPTANDNDTIFPKNCQLVGMEPPADWSCPKDNTLLWANSVTPIPLPARSAIEFIAAVEPGAPSAGTDIDALIVQANVFTTVGSFGKGEGYQSTMRSGETPLVSVFLTTTPEDRTDFHGVQNTGIMEEIESTFMVSLADMDIEDDTYIEDGAKFIINVPRLWTDIEITDSTGFVADGDPDPLVDDRIIPLGDGSTQLLLVTAVDIGGPLPTDKDVLTVTFDATPPCNEIATDKRPYIMYILADGQTGPPADAFPIGPLNEIALIVDPDITTECTPQSLP